MRTTLSCAALLVVLAAVPASAHVTVHGPEAAQGGFAKITFQVPTEKDIPTTKLEIDLPVDQPLAFVSLEPHAGWTAAVTKTKLATALDVEGEKVTEVTSKIVWTAEKGQGIAPGYFDEFAISAGFLPKADEMTFKALQTYSDGSVVRWIELPTTGAAEPEHPAPVLKLAPAAADAMAAASPSPSPTVTATATATATVEPEAKESSDALGGTGLGVGIAGLLLGGTALLRTRRRA